MAGEAADNGRRLSLIALDLANQSDPAEMATRVAGLAAKLIACTAADIVHPAGAGAIRVAASSDSVLSLSSAKLWQRWPHPPAAAVPNARNLSYPDPAGYREQLRTDCGIANELLLELRVGFTDHGYLRFLFRDENRLPPADIELITAYCIHAALALDRAALRVQADTLRDALISNRQIGTAIGILMTRRGIEYEPAFALLKTRSQRANRKLHRVAADVVRTGKLPAEIDRRTSASMDRQTGRQWFSVG